MIQFRAMKQNDISAVYRIETLSFRSPWSKQSLQGELNNSVAHYVIAQLDDTIIGYCGMWVMFDECHITNIAIDPAYRKKGYGKALLLATMMAADYFGATSMTLEVRETNRIAQSMYHSTDFVQSGFRKRYYSDTGEGALLLWNHNIQNTIKKNACILEKIDLKWETFEKRGSTNESIF